MSNSSVFAICGTALVLAGKHFNSEVMYSNGMWLIVAAAACAVISFLMKD